MVIRVIYKMHRLNAGSQPQRVGFVHTSVVATSNKRLSYCIRRRTVISLTFEGLKTSDRLTGETRVSVVYVSMILKQWFDFTEWGLLAGLTFKLSAMS